MNENSQKMMQQLLDNAHKAMEEFQSYSQEEIDHILFELCAAFQANAVPMAKMAVEETGMGKYEDKVMKNSGAPAGAWMAVKGQKSVGVIGEDKARRLRFIAHPKGIVGNVAPTTNPNVTTIFEYFARCGILIRRFDQYGLLRFGLPGDEAQWQRLCLSHP